MGIAGLLLSDEPEMTPEPPRPDDVETQPDCDIQSRAVPPSPAALDSSASVETMRAQFQKRGGSPTRELVKPPEYEYGFDREHGKAWRMAILGPKKRGPVEWSAPPELDLSKGPFAPVVFVFADGDSFEAGVVTQVSCPQYPQTSNLNPSLRFFEKFRIHTCSTVSS